MAAVPAMVAVPEIDQIREILTWIGFTDENHRNAITDDAFTTFDDILSLKEKEITALSEAFARRLATNGKINFGIRRTKKLKYMMHWAQDFIRVSERPTTVGLDETLFLQALNMAGERADIRKQLEEQSAVKAKESSPGSLVSESKWTDWEPKFENYLSTILGITGTPLSYVIRKNETPSRIGPFANFIEECIACAPLKGTLYDADRSTVHQALVSFTTGMPSEDWIKPVHKLKDGRKSMEALRNHFSGEGNATRRIAEADRMKETLHYKNERSLTFENFLTKCQKMYNIYDLHGEKMTEDAKIRFVFKKVDHEGLQNTVEALKTKIATENPGTFTYTTVANHISTAVSELPDFMARNRRVSGVAQGGGGGNGPTNGIHNSDGSIHTGHHPNWLTMSPTDRKKVNDERARLGLGRNKKQSRSYNRQDPKKGKYENNVSNQLTQLKAANAKHKRTIAGLKSSSSETETPPIEEDIEDAGNAFGGKTKKSKRG